MKEAIGIVLFSVAISLILNFSRPNGLSLFEKPSFENEVNGGEEGTISLKEFQNKVGKEGIIVVDVRRRIDFIEGHVPGSVNIPLEVFENELERVVSFLESYPEIIVYCYDILCDESSEAANLLREMGFENVLVFKGGWDLWKKSGGEVEVGEGTGIVDW